MITIRECGEPLVDLKKTCPGVVIRLGKKRLRREKTAYLRKTVANMLHKAQGYLPQGVNFTIGDAWRPQYIQEEIFDEFIARFSKTHPKWSKQRVLQEVNKYVADSKGKWASGHMTGGAVDLRLIKNGRKVPMKSSKLNYQENALSHQSKLPAYLRRNRQVMFAALTKAGLSNYPKEYWHWSYGDIQWARRLGKKTAIYGAINNPKIIT
ncbi:MAG: M15 family metallopeptidase [Patescibacteria group bacterium]|jgi:D-alanyl-D-alanine dipeptidase